MHSNGQMSTQNSHPGAKLLDDLGFRDLFRLDARDELAVLVLDGVDRAVNAADGAVDAALGVDVVHGRGPSPQMVFVGHFTSQTLQPMHLSVMK